MGIIKNLFDKKAVPILAAVFLVLAIAERRRKLRKPRQEVKKRVITNSLVAAPSFALLRFVFLPVMIRISLKNERFGIGLLLSCRPFLRLICAFLILEIGRAHV